MLQQHLVQFQCCLEVFYVKDRLIKLNQPPDHERIIVQVTVAGYLALAVAVAQASVVSTQLRQHKICGFPGSRGIIRMVERLGGFGEGGDHQPVPIAQDFVVFQGMDALFPHREELLPGGFQTVGQFLWCQLHFSGDGFQRCAQMRNVGPGLLTGGLLQEITFIAQIVNPNKKFRR